MMRRRLEGALRLFLRWLDTAGRDLLTERHAPRRPVRYIPIWDADASQPIRMTRADDDDDEGTDTTGRVRTTQTEDDDMANYYIIIHCCKCGTPVQAKKKGSKGKIIRICAACAAALRRRSRAA